MSHKKLIRRPAGNGKTIALALEGAPASGGRVATIPLPDGREQIYRGYAALLVQGWNHYGSLVAALKNIQCIDDAVDDPAAALAEIMKVAEHALAEAGEA